MTKLLMAKLFLMRLASRASRLLFTGLLALGSQQALASDDLAPQVQVSSDDGTEAEYVAVPFIFATESLSTSVGAAGVVKHAGQRQASLFALGLGTANDSWVTYLGANDYQLPGVDSWLFSGEYYRARYTEGIFYIPGQEVGRAADAPERVVTQGDESFARLHLKYVLPWGRGAKGAAASLRSAPLGNQEWNPLTSGVSSIELTPFYTEQRLEGYESLPQSARGLELELAWDNRDDRENSKQGGRTSLTLTRDWGSSQRQSWTTWEFEQSLYLSLGQSGWFDSRVLAFNFYLADTPTWNDFDPNSHTNGRPPGFAGVGLGGFKRLRGYSGDQFTGRSALLYAAEYRLEPKWQPLQSLPVFRWFDIPWWQWTAFVEAGKVSDEFALDSLHSQMKTSFGAGIRFEVEGVVVRTDLAIGEEESQFWVMVNQPF
ncbi:hypothetical protein [Shewanella sp. KCT]|uniref:hypothetical protein n=1 Tax=Shewanella sp. KCT TaxID=2569535 RepID=UPI0011829A69|nr:hypothetical protein [Shewanella sp. KCT]TVP13323.1 hypothetical protein AYI87_13220 [Shewanella sp. KCT]